MSKRLSTTFLFFFVAISSDSHIRLSQAVVFVNNFFLTSEVFSGSAVASHAARVLTFLLSVPPHQRQLAYNSTAHGRSQHISAGFSKVGHLLFFIVIV